MRTALTIAGSDSSGGAGIQADIKTMMANGVYAMSAITALTAQNTTGVTAIMEATEEFLGEELDNIFTDIFPDAVKIGMVSSSGLIIKIAEKLKEYDAKNIVVDPVMVATSGAKLISDEAIASLKEELLPLACILTPNIPEAEVLSVLRAAESRAPSPARQPAHFPQAPGPSRMNAALSSPGFSSMRPCEIIWRKFFSGRPTLHTEVLKNPPARSWRSV